MDIRERIDILSQAAAYDDLVCQKPDYGLCAPESIEGPPGPNLMRSISQVVAPGGRCVPVLKILQTSACQNDCNYCAFRAGRALRRAHLTPDELSRGFDLMHRAGLVEGLFLSSGIVNTMRTMDEMLATAELLRGKYGFRGYIHMKLLPNAEPAQIARAVQLADRVSANLEGPTAEALSFLAPQKAMIELVGPLREASAQIRMLRQGTPPAMGGGRLGMSTQFVVGPAGETDRELLSTAQTLYREVRLSRAYYSAFSPVRDTPLADAAPTDPRREFRLYQADFLLRFYRFGVEELPFTGTGELDQSVDPKTAWARAHPEQFPIELNRAPLAQLLRIPGIGPTSARAILQARRQGTLSSLHHLRQMGARADQAAPYITIAGRRPPHQLPLPLR
jgi:predicted DNA-binding helix-hairpin-helix protein